MKKKAMTLAEILVALSIIGFISLLTIPVLYDSFIQYTNKLAIIKAHKLINETVDNLLNNSMYYTTDLDFTYTKSSVAQNDLTKFRNAFKSLIENPRTESCYIINPDSFNKNANVENFLTESNTCFVSTDNIAWGIPDTDFTSETTSVFNDMNYLPIVVYINYNKKEMYDDSINYFKNNAIIYGVRRDGQIVFIDLAEYDYPLHHEAQNYIAGEN